MSPLEAQAQVQRTGVNAQVAEQAAQSFHGPDQEGKDGRFSRLGMNLSVLYHDYQAHLDRGRAARTYEVPPALNGLARIQNGSVVIDVIAEPSRGKALLRDLERLGLRAGARQGRLVSGRLPIRQLEGAAGLGSLRSARLSAAKSWAGAVTSQADVAMQSDEVRQDVGVDGSGQTVGVLSDSYNALGGAQDGINSGDLPPADRINVLADLGDGSDEGRAMMELIFDVAPGANLAFHTAFNGRADFAQGIRELADAGSDVIVDDIIYFAEPMFQEGIIAQAATEVSNNGHAYFSSAGNNARQSYSDEYRETPSGFHDFDPGGETDVTQTINVEVGKAPIFSFQWDDPYASAGGNSADGDLDIIIYDKRGGVVARGNADNIGGDPVELFRFVNDGSIDADDDGVPDTEFQVAFQRVDGQAPTQVKYVWFGNLSVLEHATNSPTSYGHNNAEGAIAVGAAFYQDTPQFGTSPPVREGFSSAGGVPIFFDQDGNRLGSPEVRDKPEVTAPDGTNNTFFGQDVEGDGFPNFFGTSAAAPHAAAVAALQLGADAGLTPSDIESAQRNSAIDMADAGFDFDTGAGLIQAPQAVEEDASPPAVSIDPLSFDETLTVGNSTTRPLTIGNTGEGPLNFDVDVFFGGAVDMEGIRARHRANRVPESEFEAPQTLSGTATTSGGGAANLGGQAEAIADNESWTSLASMNSARGQHGAVAHPNGKIYAMGGFDAGGSIQSSMEVYDPASNSWSFAAPLPEPNRGMATAVDNQGRIYVFGGFNGQGTVENGYRYSPEADEWESIATPPTPVWEGEAVRGPDGRIYLIGGELSGGPEVTNAVQVYDPSADQWTEGAPLPTPRKQHEVERGPSGLIYVFGGRSGGSAVSSVEVYDPQAGTWSTASDMPTARNQFGTARLPDGRLFAFGGKESYVNNTGPFLSVTEVYDPSTDSWEAGPALPAGIGENAGVFLGRDLYSIGGTNGTPTSAVIAIEDVAGPQWLTVSPSSGTVDVNNSADLNTEFDATNLAPDVYEAQIIVSTNDPSQPRTEIPAQLNVTQAEPPEIVFQKASLNQSVVSGETDNGTLTMSNTGEGPLEFSIRAREPAEEAAERPLDRFGQKEADRASNKFAAEQDKRMPEQHQQDAEVLLIKNGAPWGSEANEIVLQENGIPYDLINSGSIGDTDFGRYNVVIVAGEQGGTFYDDVEAASAKFSDYVQGGGVLEFHAATNGPIDGLELPGGMIVDDRPVFEENEVLLPNHPLMEDVPNPFTGTFASHANFRQIPDEATLIARDGNAPNLVEYGVGAGMVIASGQTLEFGFSRGQDAGIILQNMIPYAVQQAGLPWLSVSPGTGTLEAGNSLDLDLRFDARGLDPGRTLEGVITVESNDFDDTPTDIPVTMTVEDNPQQVAVSPDRIETRVSAGREKNETATISNEGLGAPLEFSFPGFAAAQRLTEVSASQHNETGKEYQEVNLEKEEEDPRTGPAVTLGAGGPDDFGYRWIDSNEPGGPSFDFVNITDVGTEVSLSDDDGERVSLPFTFDFYGDSKTEVTISSNGYLVFGDDPDPFQYTNDPIPNGDSPNDAIYPFWDDLDPGDGGTIHYLRDEANGLFIVQWTNVPYFDDADASNTFQIILDENGSMLVQYQNIDERQSATVGVEDSSGTDALQVAFNTEYVEDNLALSIARAPSDIVTDVEPASGSIGPGESQDVTLSLTAEGREPGDTVEDVVDIMTNDASDRQVEVPVTMNVDQANPPEIAFQKASLSRTVTTGETASQALTMSNTGQGPLEFSIATQQPEAQEAEEGLNTFGQAESPDRATDEFPAEEMERTPEQNVENAEVLIVQDRNPWGQNANQAILEELGVPFDIINSGSIENTSFSPYDVVIVSSVQPGPFYDALRQTEEKFAEYVQNGGVLEFHAAIFSGTTENVEGLELPGGMGIEFDFVRENPVLRPNHPLMEGVPDTIRGNAASHSRFTSIPEGATEIVTDGQAPNLVEYNVGDGTVIASGQTLEFYYFSGGDPGIVLRNLIPYSLEQGGGLPWLSVSPSTGTLEAENSLDLDVEFDASEREPGTTLQGVISVASNDLDATPTNIPVSMTVQEANPPVISVDPSSLEQSLITGATGEQTLTINNTGEGDLTFTANTAAAGVEDVEEQGLLDSFVNAEDPDRASNEFAAEDAERTPEQNQQGADVLLIQDSDPWGFESNEIVLQENGIPYDLINSGSIEDTNFSAYEVVIVSSVQPQSFYDVLRQTEEKFATYVRGGGVLEFHAAIFGDTDVSGLDLPGGMALEHDLQEENAVLQDHPLVEGVSDVFTGNFASHTHFQDIPDGAIEIVSDGQAPNLVQYNIGAGTVIASGQTLEWGFNFGQEAGIILQNMIPYSVEQGSTLRWLSLSQTSGTVEPGNSLDLAAAFDATGLSPETRFEGTIRIESNDFDQSPLEVPASLLVQQPNPPEIAVSPESLSTSLDDQEDATGTETLTLRNDGDGADLDYRVSVLFENAQQAAAQQRNIRERHQANRIQATELVRPQEENDDLTAGGSPNLEEDPEVAANNESWSSLSSMNVARGQHGVVAHPNGRIYALGGFGSNGTVLASAEVYRPARDAWSSVASMPEASRGMATAVDNQRRIYVFGGSNGEGTIENGYRYYPEANEWESTAAPPIPVWEGEAALGPDGRIYLIGGELSGGTEVTNAVQVYDPGQDEWSEGAPMPTARKQHEVERGPSGLIYVFGGRTADDGPISSVEVFDPATGTWSEASSLPTARNQFGTARNSDGRIFVFGGKESYGNNTGPFFSATEIYNPYTDRWSSGPALPAGLGENGGVFLNGTIYSVGGTDGSPVSAVIALEDIGQQWLTVSPGAGSVAAGNSQQLTATFDPGDLQPATYEATLRIESSDREDSPLDVPVSMTVGGVEESCPVAWSLEMTATANLEEEVTQTLELGQSPVASGGLDAQCEEEALPPLGPAPSFDVRLVGDGLPNVNLGSGSRADYRSAEGGDDMVVPENAWLIDATGGQFSLSWNRQSLQESLPQNDVSLVDAGTGGDEVDVDMQEEGSADVPGSVDRLRVEVKQVEITETVTFQDGWNLVSVPVQAQDMSFGSLFENCRTGYIYSPGEEYQRLQDDDPVPVGRGIYANCSQEEVDITGTPARPMESFVETGWNLIGPYENAVPVQGVTSDPEGTITSNFLKFNPASGLVQASSLEPGLGYWVKVSEEGRLLYPAVQNQQPALAGKNTAENVPGSPDESQKPAGMRITVTDAAGEEESLLLVNDTVDASLERFTLPPKPPSGSGLFDVRFENGRDAVQNKGGGGSTVELQGAEFPITVRAEELEGQIVEVKTSGSGPLRLTENQPNARLEKSVSQLTLTPTEKPDEFALKANYPNPVQQATTIEYALPESRNVSLEVYDILGRRVATLVRGKKQPGEHTISFDVSGYSSGVYIYRLKAGSFQEVQRMTVVR